MTTVLLETAYEDSNVVYGPHVLTITFNKVCPLNCNENKYMN